MPSPSLKIALTDEQRAELLVRRVAAFFASVLISPGAGQLALGRRWRGGFWFVLGVLTVLPGPLFSIWAFYANLPLRFLSGVDAALLAPPRPEGAGPLDRMPRWAAVVGLWCALMAATFGLKLAAPHFYVGILAADAQMAPTIAIDEQVLVYTDKQAGVGDIVALQASDAGAVTLERVLAIGGQGIALTGGVPQVGGKALKHEATTGSCSYRCPQQQKTAANAPLPPRKTCPCSAAREFHAGRSYTVLTPTAKAADVSARVLTRDELWVWGDNRIEDRAPRIVSRGRVLGRVGAIWLAKKPGGLDWDRIGKKLP